MDSHQRKNELKRFAATQLRYGRNRACALVNIVKKAADLVNGLRTPGALMIDDLEKVLIGTDMRNGRGRGGYFVGNFTGSEGFKKDLRDPYNQVQHATAGVVIGFRYGIAGKWFAMWQEQEPQDDRLYEVTCPLGRWLNDSNYHSLGDRLCSAICDDVSVCLGPIIGPGDFPDITTFERTASRIV